MIVNHLFTNIWHIQLLHLQPIIPTSSQQIEKVANFQELVTKPFEGATNALCWSRKLVGDFEEIVNKVKSKSNMTELSPEELNSLDLSENGQLAREVILKDLKLLKDHGASPILNLIEHYERDDAFPILPTDVYSFHVDRSPIPTATFLCTYHGEPSEIVHNSQAIQKILIPELRAELKKLHDGPEEGFDSFLVEYFFDLHYQPLPGANIVNLGQGHLWKLAVDHPESKVLPCLHRAPKEKIGEPRLLLIC